MGTITYSPTTWTNGNVTITGKATDVGSGIVAYQFSTSGSLTASSGGWTSITNTKSEISKTYSASSNGTYYFYAKDAQNNINKKSVVISKIDKTKPTITTPTISNISDGSFTVNSTFNDTNSGLSKIVVYYKTSSSSTYTDQTTTYTTMNGGTTGATGSQTKSITINNLAPGTIYNVYVVGYDVSGNSVQSSTVTTTTKKYVAQIGSTKYETLAAAVNAAGTTETTILMLDNVKESVTIHSTKSIILNLSGKTVTGNMVNQGKLTITGNGTLTSTKGVTLTNEGTVYIEKTTITNKKEFDGNGFVFKNAKAGTAYMNSGNIVQLFGGTHAVLNSGTLNINGGEISLVEEGSSTALYISDGGKVNMSGGLIDSTAFGLCVDDGNFSGTGGTITSANNITNTVLVRNRGSAKFVSMKIIEANSKTAVSNQTTSGNNCVIRSRDTNYGVTGRIDGKVIATTNTGPGQAKENVTIYNPGTAQVYFPNWTEKNGQDDIEWRLGNLVGDNVTTTINAKPKDEGTYHVHIYQGSNGQATNFLGSVDLIFYDDSDTEIIDFDTRIENVTSSSYDVIVYNIKCTYGIKNVQVPTWSEANGQDDIKWLEATKQSDGTYKAHIDRSEYTDSGTFKSHVYVYDTAGNGKSKDAGTVELSGWGQWHASTWQSVWNNGCYEIRVLWSYRQDAESNQTQIRLEQLQCASLTPYHTYHNYEGSTSIGVAGVGNVGNSTSASPSMTVNPNSSYTWDNPDIITTVTHNSDGSWPNPAGQFMWRANIGQYNTPEVGWSNFYVSVPKINK